MGGRGGGPVRQGRRGAGERQVPEVQARRGAGGARPPHEVWGERGRGGSGAARGGSRRRTLNKCVSPVHHHRRRRCHHFPDRDRGASTATAKHAAAWPHSRPYCPSERR